VTDVVEAVRSEGPLAPAPELPEPSALQKLRYGFDPEGFFSAGRRRYGDTFTVRVLSEPWTVLADPGAVKEVFAHGPKEMNSGEPNLPLRPLIGTQSVLLSDGDEHMRRRKLVLPPFHGDRMRAYETVIREMAAAEISSWPLGRRAPALPRLQTLTFGVILRCVFGTDEDAESATLAAELRQTLSWVTDMRRVLMIGFLGPDRVMSMRRFRAQVEGVDREIEALIQRRRSEDDLEERADILSMLLQARDEAGQGLSPRELRDELVTLLVAGHETTASALAWALHDLARDPASQNRLADSPGGFCEAVVTETLRLHPPVPFVLRKLREPLTIAGRRMPAGATLAPCMLLVHRRADIYPDPWAFRPERFLERRPVASEWFPFGGAVRRCIGAAFAQFEAKIVLEEMTRALSFAPGRHRPERVARRGPVLIPAQGAQLTAARRR
jgi:cytochrome P450